MRRDGTNVKVAAVIEGQRHEKTGCDIEFLWSWPGRQCSLEAGATGRTGDKQQIG